MINKNALLIELNKRKLAMDKPVFDFLAYTFKAQHIFFREQGNRFRIAVCSRRAGKSCGIAADMIDTAIKEKEVNLLYITQTQGAARNIIWGEITKIIEDFDINCKIDNTRLTVVFENKSKIYLAGAKDRTEVSKFRGYKLKKCYIDEGQSIRPSILTELINDVIIPALRDLRGSLFITGTPGVVKAGPYYEYSQSENWFTHEWDAFSNPYMHNPPKLDLEQTLAEERIMRGIDETDPSYIRETYGKWIEDLDALVFKFNTDRNIYEKQPTQDLTYIMGVDLGWDDADAIAVLAFNNTDKEIYLIDEYEKSKQTVSDLVLKIKYYKDKYDPIKIVVDAGALGKKVNEEIRQRHGIHMSAAEKSRKIEFIELLNDDLRTGKFKSFKNSLFEEDCKLLTWDKDSVLKNPERPKISSAYHTNIGDAVLYAWRECRHYLSEKPEDKITIHNKPDEYMKKQEAIEAEKLKRQLKDPDGFDLEQEFEADCEELDSIIDMWDY